LLALGWAAALRRSEVVSLDWQKLGAGGGFVNVDERGIVVTLIASKASQDQAKSIVVPRQNMPKACQALEAWAVVAKLEAGEAVFRAINQWQHISAVRLTDHSVAHIVKSRVKELVKERGRSEAEADELVKLISGHRVHELVPFAYTATRFGGRRQWLTCLKCNRRCRKIYDRRHFRCRQCQGLVHASTREPPYHRALDRAERLRKRLGGAANAFGTLYDNRSPQTIAQRIVVD
jgi:hypothetical protein